MILPGVVHQKSQIVWLLWVVVEWVFLLWVAEVLVWLFVVEVIYWIRQMLRSYFGLVVVVVVVYWIRQMHWS